MFDCYFGFGQDRFRGFAVEDLWSGFSGLVLPYRQDSVISSFVLGERQKRRNQTNSNLGLVRTRSDLVRGQGRAFANAMFTDMAVKNDTSTKQTQRVTMVGEIPVASGTAERSPLCPMQPLDGGKTSIQEEHTSNRTLASQAPSSSTDKRTAAYIASL
ncbi:unnamed protein product [Lactuca saligna]|uniref:Uncharacterized protein n=1 Tax=Lactuca saligna TaxID=75948 RepID=A0AA36ENC4_LACSI|nr:unnamed protein product [Lactuca saligna]